MQEADLSTPMQRSVAFSDAAKQEEEASATASRRVSETKQEESSLISSQPSAVQEADQAEAPRRYTVVGRSLYTELRVSPSANQEDIKQAYRKLARKFHPDKNSGNEEVAKKFQRIARAYEILKDPYKKKIYDKYGSEGVRLYEEMNGERSGPQSFFDRHPCLKVFYYAAWGLTCGFGCCCCCWCCNCCGGRCTEPMTRIFGESIVGIYYEAKKEARLRQVLQEQAEEDDMSES